MPIAFNISLPPSPKNPASIVAVIALGCTGLLALLWMTTKPTIDRAKDQLLQDQLHAVLENIDYDNQLTTDTTEIDTPEGIVTVYRARLNNLPVAAIYDTVTLSGYSGAIRLVVGIDTGGSITGVRVLEHRETPGLGDAIDIEKSDWITNFKMHSLETRSQTQWQVKKDGGEFDQFTGATITPRAVVNAVFNTLDRHRMSGGNVFK